MATNPKPPEQLQADALKRWADQAAAHLKVAKQQKRLGGINKSMARLHSNS